MIDNANKLQSKVYDLIDYLYDFEEKYYKKLNGKAYEMFCYALDEADGVIDYLGKMIYELEKERNEQMTLRELMELLTKLVEQNGEQILDYKVILDGCFYGCDIKDTEFVVDHNEKDIVIE